MSQANNPSAIIGPNECSPFHAEGYLQRSSNRINSRAGGGQRISQTRSSSSSPGRCDMPNKRVKVNHRTRKPA